MIKKGRIEQFIKLKTSEKANLTLSWLIDFVKAENLTIEDVMDILNCIEPTFSKTDKINSLLTSGTISVSIISRLFGYGYAKSMNIINSLVKQNIITKQDNCYKIIDKENFKLKTAKLISAETDKK